MSATQTLERHPNARWDCAITTQRSARSCRQTAPRGASADTRRTPSATANTFVIAWDSNIAADLAQYNWIRAQLDGLDRRRYTNVIVVEHHPAFSSGYHGAAILEQQTATIRAWYMPLFRRCHVRLMLAGHEHLFEHWVERYQDSTGAAYQLDEIVSGGGGAPLYSYQGEPDLRAYLTAGRAEKVAVDHLAKPGMMPGENPYHYLVVHVNGTHLRIDVISVDFGRDFRPYRSASADLEAAATPP